MFCSVKQDLDLNDSIVSVMLELVRAAVLEKRPFIPQNITIDWDRLMEISAEQGLVAWVWIGVEKLPEEQKPPRLQKINWSLSAQAIQERYEYQVTVLKEMLDVCKRNNIRLMVIKGIGLSSLYPDPSCRPSGDIDIFLFDSYNKGNELFAKDKIHETGKHAKLEYKGVNIENHLNFLNVKWPVRREVENYIKSNLSKSVLTQEGYYILEPESNLLYLIMHAIRHLNYVETGLTLRSIIDIPIFLNHYRDLLTPDRCYELMNKFKIAHCFELMVYLGEWALGINLAHYHRGYVPISDQEAAYNMFIKCNYIRFIPTEIPYFRYLKLSLIQFRQCQWKYHYEHVSTFSRVYLFVRKQLHVFVKYCLGVERSKALKNVFEKKSNDGNK